MDNEEKTVDSLILPDNIKTKNLAKEIQSMQMDNVVLQEEYNTDNFLILYKPLLKRYLAQGQPSADTLASYYSFIDSYIKWCIINKVHPLTVTEYQFIYYRDYLIKNNMKKGSIKAKLNAIKQFYNIAKRIQLIETNPAEDIGVKNYEEKGISPLKFLNIKQLNTLLSIIPSDSPGNTNCLRDKAMIMLMALEGLRTVEVHRLSVADIDFRKKVIFVHGKGHNDYIYPREDVLNILYLYINSRETTLASVDEYGEPVFISNSNNNKGKRIDRRGIRYNIDKWLDKAGFKKAGISCHMLRHTCGTLIYAKTKDLQIVKEVLRHSDINITSKYAHIYNNLDNRYTASIDLNDENME